MPFSPLSRRRSSGSIALVVTVEEFASSARKHLGMYTLGSSFAEACALLVGYDAGAEGDLLERFRTWLIRRDRDRPELAFPTLVLRQALPGDSPRDAMSLTAAQNLAAVDAPFSLFDEFLAARSA